MTNGELYKQDTEHIECDCVPDLGPSHCHLCESTWRKLWLRSRLAPHFQQTKGKDND
jgi:hypothetical protein